MPSFAELRREYALAGLDERDVHPDPLVQFGRWFAAAREAGVTEPNAMVLATVGVDGTPDARTMLLKELDQGFVFYTNTLSKKGRELAARPRATLLFVWLDLERQVRVAGTVEPVTAAEADAYFAVRPRASQLGAWASPQSEVVPGRDTLEASFAEHERRFEGLPVPRPPHWSGYRLMPDRVELWQGRPGRLHDRLQYLREGAHFTLRRLAP